MTQEGQVALWLMRHHAPEYELCESEQDAARLAVAIMDGGGSAVTGVQFADGRLIALDDWEAYAAARRWWEEQEQEQRLASSSRAPKPTREIRDPFGNQVLTVDAGEPSWLGSGAVAR